MDVQPAVSEEPGSRRGKPLPSPATGQVNDGTEAARTVAANLRLLRRRKGLSLERLAQRSGVSRAMLSQIELGRSAPKINIVWKIAGALEVTFSALITQRSAPAATVLSAAGAKVLTNHAGTFTSRALFPFDRPRRTEFYELRLTVGGEEQAEPHAAGTCENLVVARGSVEIRVQSVVHKLGVGDAIVFAADVPHSYRNTAAIDASMYLVMTYDETMG